MRTKLLKRVRQRYSIRHIKTYTTECISLLDGDKELFNWWLHGKYALSFKESLFRAKKMLKEIILKEYSYLGIRRNSLKNRKLY